MTGQPPHPSEVRSLVLHFDASVKKDRAADTQSTALGYTLATNTGYRVGSGYCALDEPISTSHAEARALIFALEHAVEFPNVDCIYIYGDAESVIETVDPDSSPSARDAELKDYVTRARGLLQNFEVANLSHSKRDNNQEAHDIAQRGHRLSPRDGPEYDGMLTPSTPKTV